MDYTNEDLNFTPTELWKQYCSGKRTARKADNLSLSSGSSVSGTTGKNHLGLSEMCIRHQAAHRNSTWLLAKQPSTGIKHTGKNWDREQTSTQLLLNTAEEESPASARGHLPAPGTKLWLSQPS